MAAKLNLDKLDLQIIHARRQIAQKVPLEHIRHGQNPFFRGLVHRFRLEAHHLFGLELHRSIGQTADAILDPLQIR